MRGRRFVATHTRATVRICIIVATLIVGPLLTANIARAAVLCAKPRKDGTFNSSVKIREACKQNEVELAPGLVGFCCGVTTSTTTSSSSLPSTCPSTSTTTTIPACEPVCPLSDAFCTNGHTCEGNDMGGCGCTGPPPSCGQWGIIACGGTCPAGSECALENVAPSSCPEVPVCHCVPAP